MTAGIGGQPGFPADPFEGPRALDRRPLGYNTDVGAFWEGDRRTAGLAAGTLLVAAGFASALALAGVASGQPPTIPTPPVPAPPAAKPPVPPPPVSTPPVTPPPPVSTPSPPKPGPPDPPRSEERRVGKG